MAVRYYGRPVAVLLAALLVGACSGSAATSSPVATPAPSDPASTASPAAPASGPANGLVLLGTDTARGKGLWTCGQGSSWTLAASLPGADAIASSADGVLVAGAQTLENHPASALSTASHTTQLTWPASTSPRPLAAVSVSPSGRLALVFGLQGSVSYAIASSEGMVSAVEPAPSQPFTPLVAWLDQTRRIALTTDAKQVSHLAVSNDGKTYTDLSGVSGARWFGVSADGGTIAAVTDSQLYVGQTSSWLAGSTLQPVAQIPAGSVAWGLALDRAGGRLAVLIGTVGSDGIVSGIHDVIYQLKNGTWQKMLDLEVGLALVTAQVWAN